MGHILGGLIGNEFVITIKITAIILPSDARCPGTGMNTALMLSEMRLCLALEISRTLICQ